MMSIFQKDGFLEANILLEPYQPFEVSRSWKGIINIFTKEEIRKEIFSFYRVNIFHWAFIEIL